MRRQIITKQAERAQHKAKLEQFDAFIQDKGFARHMPAERIPKNPATMAAVYHKAGVSKEGDFVTFPDYPELRFAVRSAAIWVENVMVTIPNMPKVAVPVKEHKAAIMLELFGVPGCHFWINLAEYLHMFNRKPDPLDELFATPTTGRRRGMLSGQPQAIPRRSSPYLTPDDPPEDRPDAEF